MLTLRWRVGELMRQKGLKEAQVADRAKVARNTVRSLERGVSTRVDLATMEKIAAALEVRPSELLEETETPAAR